MSITTYTTTRNIAPAHWETLFVDFVECSGSQYWCGLFELQAKDAQGNWYDASYQNVETFEGDFRYRITDTENDDEVTEWITEAMIVERLSKHPEASRRMNMLLDEDTSWDGNVCDCLMQLLTFEEIIYG